MIHAEVPESPYYVSSPGSFRSVRAWVDEDGQHAVVAHDCKSTREVHPLRWPTWQVVGDEVKPSFSCGTCGLHAFVLIDAVLTAAPRPPQGGEEFSDE